MWKFTNKSVPNNNHTEKLVNFPVTALNYSKNDCDQETGKEYSTILQIIVKDDRWKALAWRSVSCNMTCYQVSDEKNSTNSQSAFRTQYAVCSLRFAPSRHFLPGLQSALCTDRIGIIAFVQASQKYWGLIRNFSENILAAMIDVWTVYWRVPEDKHNDRAIIRVP